MWIKSNRGREIAFKELSKAKIAHYSYAFFCKSKREGNFRSLDLNFSTFWWWWEQIHPCFFNLLDLKYITCWSSLHTGRGFLTNPCVPGDLFSCHVMPMAERKATEWWWAIGDNKSISLVPTTFGAPTKIHDYKRVHHMFSRILNLWFCFAKSSFLRGLSVMINSHIGMYDLYRKLLHCWKTKQRKFCVTIKVFKIVIR